LSGEKVIFVLIFFFGNPYFWKRNLLRDEGGTRGGNQTLVLFSWSYQNWLGLSLDFLGPIGFVAATWQANWPQAALVKRDINPAKTAL
jgi:hypothetical protein